MKLYDLTALSSEEDQGSNPFTDPLGMLLYRVARNIWQQNKMEKLPTIRTLLENCLLLLGKDRHSQVHVLRTKINNLQYICTMTCQKCMLILI